MDPQKKQVDIDYVYFAEVELFLNFGVGYPDIVVKLREKVYQEGLDDSIYVKKTDRKLIQNVHKFLEAMDISDEPLQDDNSQPLEKWWWHLHKIAKGKYPSLTFPEYLREIYRKRRKYWKQKASVQVLGKRSSANNLPTVSL